MTIDAPIDMRAAPVPAFAAFDGLLAGPILPTLLKLALPNSIAMFGGTLVAVAETSYIGRLGTEPLAGIALVFPFVMLTQMMSAGAMGGGVSSAVSRALGGSNGERAANLALHYSNVLFAGAVSIWLVNTFASVVRGTGDMRVPSLVLIGVATIQVTVGG